MTLISDTILIADRCRDRRPVVQDSRGGLDWHGRQSHVRGGALGWDTSTRRPGVDRNQLDRSVESRGGRSPEVGGDRRCSAFGSFVDVACGVAILSHAYLTLSALTDFSHFYFYFSLGF